MDPPRRRGRLEAAGDVDRVAPEVVDELGCADDTGDDRAAMQADPDLPGRPDVVDDGQLIARRRSAAAAM